MTRALSRERREVVDAAVVEIVEAMVSGKWQAGKSHQELATKHGVSVDRVKDWACDAGRTLRLLSRMDTEDLRARNQARFDRIYEMALEKQAIVTRGDDVEVVPQPDLKAAVSALAEQAKLLGLNAPDRVQHAHVVATYEQLDAPSRLAQLDDAIATLTAERDALRAETALEVKRVPGASSGQDGAVRICQPVLGEPGGDDV